jgi:regulator of nucleoside diphosphate kinase
MRGAGRLSFSLPLIRWWKNMTAALKMAGSKRPPPIHLSEADYDRIADLAIRIEQRSPDLSQLLFKEIDRAVLHPAESLPRNVVALGSEVEFADVTTGATRRVRLVLPADADIEQGRVSILTPVGAGLIGMSVGREIDWPCPNGRPRVLRILDVKQQP